MVRSQVKTLRTPARQGPHWKTLLREVATRVDLTFDGLAHGFLIEVKRTGGRNGGPAKPATVRSVESALNAVLLPAFGDLLARDLTAQIIVAELESLGLRAYAELTKGRLLWTLSDFCKYAVSVGAADRNPVVDVPREARPRKRVKDRGRSKTCVLSLGEIARLIYADHIPFERRFLWALLLLTGGRVGEVVALRFGDWAPELMPLGQLAIRRTYDCKAETDTPGKLGVFVDTKTDDIRYFPTHPALIPFCFESRDNYVRRNGCMPGPEVLLCDRHVPKSGGRRSIWHPPTVLINFRDDLESVGVSAPASGPRKTHDTRHTLINRLRRAGVDSFTVQAITHSASEIAHGSAFAGYVQVDHEEMSRAMTKLRICRGKKT